MYNYMKQTHRNMNWSQIS